jgi:hypothetical protein
MMRRAVCLLGFAACLSAAVSRVFIVERSDAPANYERIVAKAHFQIDPNLPANRIIRDIDCAPRNAQGRVEFSADVEVLRPRDVSQSNGTILLEVPNRGSKNLLSRFNFAAPGREYGDQFLMEQGYILVWLGWQFDVPKEGHPLRLDAPSCSGVAGLVRAEFVPDIMTSLMPLADRNHIPYPLAGKEITLTVRDTITGPRQPLTGVTVSSDGGHIGLAAGFVPGKIYEAIYRAADPPVAGLGLAAVRDFIAFLRYDGSGLWPLGDTRTSAKRVIGYGVSQSGRFLRHYLYDGFNADEKGRIVFDGVWADVAGAGRGGFNMRFAQPSRDGPPYNNFFYPVDLFPFTDLPEEDEDTGRKAGLLDAAQKAGVAPKIFYTNGSFEYWGRAAALIHTTADGKKDAPLAPGTRVYFIAGTQHGPGTMPPRRQNTKYLNSPADQRFILRALLGDMQEWLKDGTEPPPPEYPHIAAEQLVDAASLPGTPHPKLAWRSDYGPEFAERGIASQEPPVLGKPFPALVPQVDKDGIDVGGIRLPEVAVPLGRFMGWNVATDKPEMISMDGGFIPFPDERYASREDYLKRIEAEARKLAERRLMLERDIARSVQRADDLWDFVHRLR